MSENKCIFVKNFPSNFQIHDVKELLFHFGAKNVSVLGNKKKTAFAYYSHELEAKDALTRLHQLEILNCKLSVEYARTKIDLTSTTDSNREEISNNEQFKYLNEYVKKLHSVHSHLNFQQPPLPYLKYKYPKPNREIIDSICVALESVPKFYTQVIHLMNKMNLPPPFSLQSKNVKRFNDASQQTDVCSVLSPLERFAAADEDNDESELELDDSYNMKKEIIPEMNRMKRKQTINVRDAAKKLKYSQDRQPKVPSKQGTIEMFEKSQFVQTKKIEMHIPEKMAETDVNVEAVCTNLIEDRKSPDSNCFRIISDEELQENRLTADQMRELPVFKNYSPGTKSNKLYIKNLSKSVTEDDLKRIFLKFVKLDPKEIDIKLMQAGRMKGQAFISFKTPYEDNEDEDCLQSKKPNETMIERALKQTNGYILKDKPMIVMFGKAIKD